MQFSNWIALYILILLVILSIGVPTKAMFYNLFVDEDSPSLSILKKIKKARDPNDEVEAALYEKAGYIMNSYQEKIYITDAVHLDKDRRKVSGIFRDTRFLDGEWSGPVKEGEHILVTFEKNLTSKNDITVFLRVVSGNPKIEVYEIGGNKIIAQFNNLSNNQYNKIFLTNLQGTQDTFDLRVTGGSVEIEHIIDPSSIYDFSTGSGTNKWAYTFANLDATAAPHTEPSLAPAGEITTAVTTTNLISYNAAFVKITGSYNDYSPLYLKLTINEDPATITNIDIDVQGIYTQTSGTNMQVWVYNFSNPGYYKQIGTNYAMTSTAAPGTNFTRSITGGFSDFINASGIMFVLFVDATANIDEWFDYVRINVSYTDNPPTWSNPSLNDSTPDPNQIIKHNILWTDDNTLSYATLEVNSSGASCDTADNVSSTTLSSASEWANLSWTVPNACEGKTIGWKQYANDSANQWNVTDLQTYVVNDITDSCTCTDGAAWTIINGDQCTLSTTCNLGTNPVRIMDGALRIDSTGILNANHCYINDGSSLFIANGGKLTCR
jgi:hypothetical protein